MSSRLNTVTFPCGCKVTRYWGDCSECGPGKHHEGDEIDPCRKHKAALNKKGRK